jgi:hypothetical protein
MVYVFYEKLPFYDLSSHKHKFIKERDAKQKNGEIYGGEEGKKIMEGKYEPPLPVSVIDKDACYGDAGSVNYKGEHNLKNNMKLNQGGQKYEPPLPTSVVKEPLKKVRDGIDIGKDAYPLSDEYRNRKKGGGYEPPLPTSIVKGCYGEIVPNSEAKYGQKCAVQYDPKLPTSMLEIKSTRGKHSTEKPVALMSWILKYYSKEGDVVLDPTMGSGSTGVACKEMNRNFIGIEMDAEIYEVAVNRIED